MKKTIAILLVAVMMLSMVACSGGVTKEQLVGTWKVTNAKVENGELLVDSTITFDSNDHYEWKAFGFTIMEGEYRISGSYVYMDDQKEKFSIDGNTLTIKDASGEMTLIRN